jgi:hypothetical protein
MGDQLDDAQADPDPWAGVATDLPMLAAGAASSCQTAGGDAPELWRRYLGIMLDGLRPGAATPLPIGPRTLEEILEAKARCE